LYFQVDLLKILDEPVQTNGDLPITTNHTHQQSTFNPLEDLLFGTGLPENHSTNGKPHSSRNSIFHINGFLAAIPPMTAFDKNGLRIIFTFERENTTLTIHSKVTNSSPYPITNFLFKAAVPKVNEKID
jgi:hypothetical protein